MYTKRCTSMLLSSARPFVWGHLGLHGCLFCGQNSKKKKKDLQEMTRMFSFGSSDEHLKMFWAGLYCNTSKCVQSGPLKSGHCKAPIRVGKSSSTITVAWLREHPALHTPRTFCIKDFFFFYLILLQFCVWIDCVSGLAIIEPASSPPLQISFSFLVARRCTGSYFAERNSLLYLL